MENTQEVPVTAAPTAEEAKEKGIQNTLGVIKVVEGLFNGMRAGSYPLHVTEQVTAGMQFLAQFHTQLVGQLPPAVVEDLRKSAAAPEASNAPVQA